MTLSMDWDQQIQAWQNSGLNQAAYCRQQGLKYGTFTMRLSPVMRRLALKTRFVSGIKVTSICLLSPGSSENAQSATMKFAASGPLTSTITV